MLFDAFMVSHLQEVFGLSWILCHVCLPTWISHIPQDMPNNTRWIPDSYSANQKIVLVERDLSADPSDCVHHWLTQLPMSRSLVRFEMPIGIYLIWLSSAKS